MKTKFRFLTAFLACICFPPAFSAQFSYEKPGTKQLLLITGRILPGDAATMLRAIKMEVRRTKNTELVIVLNTPGGDVLEALRIAEIIEKLALPVTVEGHCVSACFFLFVSGAGHVARHNSVGLHRPYLKSPHETEESLNKQKQLILAVRKYFEAKNIPSNLLDLMMSRPSTDVYWLTTSDLLSIGEYPPELEELFIAKCGYDPRRIEKILEADAALSKILEAQLERTESCIDQIRSQKFNSNFSAVLNRYIGENK